MLAGPDRFESGLLGGLRHLNHGDRIAASSEIDAKKTNFHNPSLWLPVRGESSRLNSTNRFFFVISGGALPSDDLVICLLQYANQRFASTVKPDFRKDTEYRRGRLVLSVDNMKTSLSGREPLHGATEPGPLRRRRCLRPQSKSFEREVLILHGESFIFSGGLGRGSSAATGL